MVCSAAVGSDVAQVNVEEWIRGVEMFGGEEEQQSSKKHEQDDGFVKDLFARPAGDDVQRSRQRRANDVYTTGRHLGRLGAQQKLQMQQAHARGRAGSLGRVTACSGHGIIGMPTRRRERLDDAELSSSTSFSDSVSHVLTGRASALFVWLISHQPAVLFS
jgi:hypothetical protein